MEDETDEEEEEEKNISNFKMYKEMKRHFIKDEVRISNKCSNRPPALCTVREMHGKTTVCSSQDC